MLVQLRFNTGLTSEQYVTRQAWRDAKLERCPAHPRGGCEFGRHGTYVRKRPAGTQIARWYCPQARCTWSLLPDHLAARFPGTLKELEDIVSAAEGAKSLEKLADRLCPEGVSLPSALRWLARRVRLLHRLLTLLIGLLPEQLAGCPPTVDAFRQRLCCEGVLVALRANAALPLATLPRPLGFAPGRRASGEPKKPFQQHLGPDPRYVPR
jgi:hypothetical protein